MSALVLLLVLFSSTVFCQQCASFSITHTATRLDVPTMNDDGFVDAGDRIRYCTTITRTSAATSVAYELTITDDLRVVNFRHNNTVTPTAPGFTSTFTPAPVPTMDLAMADNFLGPNPATDYFLWLPRGVFTGPQVLSDENNVCYLIADGGMSAREAGHENPLYNATGSPLSVNTVGDVLRRIRLSTGAITTIGWVQDRNTRDGTVDTEAIVLNATEPSNFILYAYNNGVLGFFRFNKSATVYPVLTASQLNLFSTISPNSGSFSYFQRDTAVVVPQSYGGVAGTFPGSAIRTVAALGDCDGLTIFPYFPYELWGAYRTGGFDPMFKLNSTAIELSRASPGMNLPYAATGTFGLGPGNTAISGAEVYTRIINDLENANRGDLPGAVMLPNVRVRTVDVDDIAFDGAIPPDFYAIANAGADPGGLVVAYYYEGAYVDNGPHPIKPVCGNNPTTCPNSEQFRTEYPGFTKLQGGFGTADFEGMSFSPDGRLHIATGKDGEPCVTYSTSATECPPGNVGCECIKPAVVGGPGTCTGSNRCVQPAPELKEQTLYGYCLPPLPTTVITAGNPGGACLNNVNVSATPAAFIAQCNNQAGGSQATGQRPRCINFGSTVGFQAYGLRCMMPQNCRSTDNYLWQVDPRSGQLKEQSTGDVYLLDQYPTGQTGDNYGDYEGIACQTEKPVRDFGPPSITWCYHVRVRDTVPASRLRFGSLSTTAISSHVILEWKCTPNDPNPPSSTEDHPPPIAIRPNPPPTVTFQSSDDDCTGMLGANNAVQIGEVFVIEITQRLIEGTTYDMKLGLSLPPGVVHVVANSSVVRRGCGNHASTIMNPAPSTITVGATQYAVFDFGNYVNPFNQMCSPNPMSAQGFNAGDEVVVRIGLRPQYNAMTGQWSRGQVMNLQPVLIYDVLNPNAATNANPNNPSMFTVDLDNFVSSNTSINVAIVEPQLSTVRNVALQSTPNSPQTVFQDGDRVRICTTITHDSVNSNACAHDPATTVTFTPMFPTNCILAGSLTPIQTSSVSTSAQCSGGTKCDGKLLLGESIIACQNATIQCPTPPPPPPTPTPTPPPTPPPQCFPLNLQWETNRNPGFPDERIYNFDDPACVTIIPPVRLGNYVWLDQNRDGLQTAGEPPIAGVIVRASRNGMQIAQTTTDASGIYFFSSAITPQLVANCAGCFSLTFTLPSGTCAGVACNTLVLTQVVGGAANDALNSDALLVGGLNTIQFATTLAVGTFNDVFDVGFQPPLTGSSIGDLVWYDEDGDGIQDGGVLEPGIPGVPVSLFDGGNLIDTTNTNANGIYSFSNTDGLVNLRTGWRLVIDTTHASLARLRLSPQNVGNDALDSDASLQGNSAVSDIPITPADGTTNTTYDFGFAPLRIGNYVWRDTDSNGLQGPAASEPFYQSASLTLIETATGVQIGAATTTNAAGEYYFRSGPLIGTGIIPGYNITPGVQYTVVLTLSSLMPATPRVQPTRIFAGDVNLDSNGLGFPLTPPFVPATTSRANVTAPAIGQSDLSIDFGLSPCFVLGDRVWRDMDRDGIQDAGEMDFTTLLDQVRVQLWTDDATPAQIAVTNTPNYQFNSCDYQLQRTTRYRLIVNSPNLGGMLWGASPTNAGGNDALDSDGTPVAGDQSIIITDPARIVNNADNDNDFGFQPPAGATIGDLVWDDANANGLQDIGEPGIPGVVVTLRGSTGNTIATCTTSAAGIYRFDETNGLQANTQYTIFIDLMQNVPLIGVFQTQYSPSLEFVGTDNAIDSNGVWTYTRLVFPNAGYATSSVATGLLTSPASGRSNLTYDFGFHRRIDIGDRLWYDGANPDGVQQAGEIPSGTFAMAGLTPVTVFLDSATTSVSTVATPQGYYLFMRRDFPNFIFPMTQYRVRVLVPSATPNAMDPLLRYQPTNADQGGNDNLDSDGVLNAARTAALTPSFASPALGGENLSLDFGFVELFRIGDYIWFDNNVDGLQTPESAATFGLANVTVDLWTVSGMAPFTSTVSTANGYYEFNSRSNPGMAVNTQYVVSVPLCAPGINCDNRNPVLRRHPTDPNSAVSAAIPLVPTLTATGPDRAVDSDGQFERYSLALPSSPRSFASATTGTYGTFIQTYDFGFIEPLVIGDLVWVDSNGDGRQNEGPIGMTTTGPQPGISGVVVRLYTGSTTTGSPLATCTTGADGKYYFSSHLVNLQLATQYTVAIDVTQPALVNYAISPSNAGADDIGDSDGATNGANSQVTLTSPAAGQPRIDLKWDFGFIPKSPTISIGDFVWIDTNRDGIQQAGEPGVANIPVILNDFSSTMMTMTNGSGYYLFQSPATGPANLVRPNTNYRIEINLAGTALANYQLTRKNAPGSTTDNDSNGVHVTELQVADTNVVTGSLGSSDLSHDFGFIPVFYVGDRVWSDLNGDGLQTNGEPGIANVNLALRGGALTIARTDATNSSGYYLFPSRAPGCVSSMTVDCTTENLQPGASYTITIRETEVIGGTTEYRLTIPNAMTNTQDALDSDFTLTGPGTGTGTSTFDHTFMATGVTDLTRDAGFIPELRIGDFVWIDTNGDGLQSAGEVGIPGVFVELMSQANMSLAVTTTNAGGLYYFSSLNTSAVAVNTRYFIRIDRMQMALNGFVATTSKVNGPGSSLVDSDGFVNGGYSVAAVTPIAAYGTPDLQYDFGFTTPLLIGDFVWIDTDGDGIQGTNERGLPGVTLQLRDSTGTPIATAVTDANGIYTFAGILQPLTTYNITINQNLPPLANAYQSSPSFAGMDRALDSNGVYGAPFITATVRTGALGSTNRTIDFGLKPQFNIGDYIWLDSTNVTGLPQSPDGCQQASETGISGVTVELYPGAGGARIAVTTSNTTGYYFFNSLTHNLNAFTSYRVSVPLRPQARNGALASYQVTRTRATCPNPTDNFDNDGTPSTPVGANIDSTATVTTGNWGSNILTVDFGFTAELAIGDFVWNDCNGNGLQDDGIPACVNGTGIEGVRVYLAIPGQAPFSQAVTNNVGQYQFKSATVQLLANTAYRLYILVADVPQYKPTLALQGSNRAADSNAVISADGLRYEIDFTSPPLGQGDLTLDFGLVKDLVIGDFAWLDNDANGRQDAGEMGIQGIQIDIVEAANPSVVVDTYTTNANGSYFFSQGLNERFPYLLRIQPDQASMINYQLTIRDAAVAGDMLDSDAQFINGQYQIAVTSPPFGGRDLTNDFGFVPRIVIGLVVWRDQDADGIRETGEARVPSVTLELRNSSGVAICSAVTNSNGTYTFNSGPNRCPGLVPNQQFNVVLLLPPGFQSSPVNAGADDTIDSDGTYDGATNTMRAAVTPNRYGYTNLTIDFGLVPEFRIGDFVWEDRDGDGRQGDDTTEPGRAGVAVQIWTANAQGQRTGTNFVAQTTTAADGSYVFASSAFPALLPTTRYVIQIVTPNNFYASPPDQGNDDSIDSDAYVFTGAQQRINMTSPIYGVSDLTNDFGIVPACAISGVVWEDRDGNGQRAMTETFLAATVTLRDSPTNLGQRDADQSITVSATNGAFSFDCQQYSIEPGKEYILIVNRTRDLPNHKETTSNVPPDTTDSDGIPDPMNPGIVTITINSPPYGSTSRNNDFGFLPVIRIGDKVWQDLESEQPGQPGHGVQSAGLNDPGIAGVPVLLLSSTGTLLFQTTTNSLGIYQISSFDYNIIPGTQYFVAVPLNDAKITGPMLTAVQPNQGGNTALDSNGVVDTASQRSRASVTIMNYGVTDLTIDFGFVPPPPQGITIGNFVWNDDNNNGRQDADEAGIAGVTVRLCTTAACTTVVGSTTTSAGGYYLFTNQGANAVPFVPNTNYVISIAPNQTPLQGTRVGKANALGGDDDNDSDGVLSATTMAVEIPMNSGPDGRIDVSFDFAFIRLEVGDYVWEDLNGNGIQDANETPLVGVTVELRDSSANAVIATTVTATGGLYIFSTQSPRNHNIAENTDYKITIALNSGPVNGYVPTPLRDAGGDDTKDSDAYLGTPTQARIDYNSNVYGTVDHTRDFGLVKLLEIGDYVFNDNNNNGIQDAGDTPRANFNVELWDGAGQTRLAQTTTNSTGYYLFSALRNDIKPNTAYLVVLPAADVTQLVPSPVSGTPDPALDSNGIFDNTKQWIQATVTTGALGSRDLTIDFGLVPLIEIGDFVWRDNNNDGLQTAGEPGINGITLILRRQSDNVEVDRTTTIADPKAPFADGYYLFTNRRSTQIRPSTQYYIVFDSNPAGLQLTKTVSGSPATDSNGLYNGGGLPQAAVTTPSGAASDRTIDFGFVPIIRIGQILFNDRLADGCREAGDPGIDGVLVQLYRRDGSTLTPIAQTTTNNLGFYEFNSLTTPAIVEGQDYVVSIATNSAPIANNAITKPDVGGACPDTRDSDCKKGTTGFEINIRTTGYVDRLDNDCGFVKPFLIGDFVFADTNGDGLQSAGEPGIPNVVVRLTRDGQTADLLTTTTNSNGLYQFSNVNPADSSLQLTQTTPYTIRVDLGQDPLLKYRLTTANVNGNNQDTIDSDFSNSGALMGQVEASLTSPQYGTDDLTWDLGMKPAVFIGDRVWDDLDGDGRQQMNEPGIPGVLVQLFCNGAKIAEQRTINDGFYGFYNADPDTDCQVCVPLQDVGLASGYEPVAATAGSDRAIDSNGIVNPARTQSCGPLRTGPLGSTDTTIDFGFARGLVLGDYVWRDNDGEGDQDSDEPGIANVVVELYRRTDDPSDPSIAPIASTRTDANGKYLFSSGNGIVTPNTLYNIVISLSKNAGVIGDNLLPTIALSSGADDTVPSDSNGVLNGVKTHVIAIASAGTPGVSKLYYDFGFVPVTCIGDYVWNDNDGNGRQDSNESGNGNVAVAVYRTNADGTRGALVCEVRTAQSTGIYRVCTNMPACTGLIPSNTPYEVTTRLTDTPNRRCSIPDVQDNSLDNIDNDGRKRGGECVTTVLIDRPGITNLTIDFGLVPTLLLGDRVFRDSNADGLDGTLQNREQELGLQFVELTLSQGLNLVETTVTNQFGKYLFGDGVMPLRQNTDYVIRINASQTSLNGVVVTKNVPNQPEIDSNGRLSGDKLFVESPARTGAYGTSDLTIDFGFRVQDPINIGQYVWIDRNNDGIRDPSERVVRGVEVRLYDPTDKVQPVASTTTDNLGRYVFNSKRDNFEPLKRYDIVLFLYQAQLTNVTIGRYRQGSDTCRDSDSIYDYGLPNGEKGSKYVGESHLIEITTPDYGIDSLCNDFALFDCVEGDPGGIDNFAGVRFTGEASIDFKNSGAFYQVYNDTLQSASIVEVFPDVGVPRQFPSGTLSGWDIRAIYAAFSPTKDQMLFGIDCFGICGDADGNGDPGAIWSGLPSGSSQYKDERDLGGSETFVMLMDLNADGKHDITMGISSIVSNNFYNVPNSLINCPGPMCGWKVYSYVADSGVDFGSRFGLVLPQFPVELYCNPSRTCPDLEWKVSNWTAMPGLLPQPYSWSVLFEVFAGSFVDGGIGEDRVPNENKPARFTFDCWKISKEDLQFPNNRQRPITGTDLTGVCMSHNCCNYDHGASCNNDLIRTEVCKIDNYCCNVVWDKKCVALAGQNPVGSCDGYLPGPTGPPAGASCAPTAAPVADDCCQVDLSRKGCSRPDITACVAAQPGGAFCNIQWDQSCVNKIATCPNPLLKTKCSPQTTQGSGPTPPPFTLAPTPSPVCVAGQLSCDCFPSNTCNVGQGICDVSTRKCVRQTCNLGSPGCQCRAGNQCDAPAVCSAFGDCVSNSCPAGQLSCQCRTDGSCNSPLICKANNCVLDSCQQGDLGCTCRTGNACNLNYVCISNICSIAPPTCPEGTLNCPCRATAIDQCVAGLTCNQARNLCQMSITPAPTPAPTPFPTPAPPGQTVAPTPSPTPEGFTTRTPSPTPMVDPNTSCISGSAGCACAGDGSCLKAELQCVNQICRAVDPMACQEGTAGCRCAANDRCTTTRATCNADKICTLPSSGKEPSTCQDNTKDVDNDGVKDCDDQDVTLGVPKDGQPAPPTQPIDVYDPKMNTGDPVGTVVVPPGNDGMARTVLSGKDDKGNPTTSTTITVMGGSVDVPNPRGGTINVPYVDVNAGTIKTLDPDTFVLICLRKRPAGFTIGQLMLASRPDSKTTSWTPVDMHVLVGSKDTYCGYTSHFTQFAIIPKSGLLGDDGAVKDAPMALNANGGSTSTAGGLEGWMIAVIVIAALLCCIILIVLVVCLARRRGGGGKPRQQRRRVDDADAATETTPMKTYDDKSVTNPAFSRDSDTPAKPPTLRGGTLGKSSGGGTMRQDTELVARPGTIGRGDARPGTLTRAAVVEDLSDTSLSSLSDDRQPARAKGKAAPRESSTALDMDAYQTMRKDVVDEERGNSIIDMSTYKTLTGNESKAGGGNDRSAIDAAIFSALESDSE